MWLQWIVVQAREKSRHMSQCLRCRKPCEATAVFCDDCRSLLRTDFRRGSAWRAGNGLNASTSVTVADGVASSVKQQGEQPDHSFQTSSTLPLTPGAMSWGPTTPVTPQPDVAEQAVTRLNEAAQRMAEVEPARRRLPHASRLAPFRDISADIRRESTPLPKFSKMDYKTDTHETADQGGAINQAPTRDEGEKMVRDDDAAVPDLWPWFDGEAEEQ